LCTPIPAQRNTAGWSAAAGRLVVQRRVNNLSGKGTRLVTCQEELDATLDGWRGEQLRVPHFLPGIPLTVSGCVAGDATIAST
jgi:hypothetical protein